MRVPIRARLALVSTALMAVALAGVGAFVYLQFRAGLLEAVDERLIAHRDAVIREGGTGTPFGEIEEDFAQVLDADGTLLASSPGIQDRPLLPSDEVNRLSGNRFFGEVVPTVEGNVEARLLAARTASDQVIVVGASLEDVNEALGRLASLLLVGGPIAVLLAGGVGWVVAGAALRPVERMREEAAAISASEPGRRLPVPDTADELARLGGTLNAMLDRLEEALERERRFVDDASHEIRTPLANLRTELELALRRSRAREELERALRSAAAESERLTRLAEDLLVLARADRGRLPVRRENVHVAEVVASVVQAFSARADESRVTVESRVPDGLRAALDPLRIRQALGNLLANSLGHTAPGGRVRIEAAATDGAISVEVADDGEGFQEDFLPHAFEPFARPDRARSRLDGGTGLGLAIVRAIAEAHGGTVEAGNRPDGGASVRLRIPI